MEPSEIPQVAIPAPRPHVVLSGRPRRLYVANALIGLTVVVFLLQLSGFLDPRLWLKDNAAIMAGEWWRLITPMLLHANLLHIGFNMYALSILGPELEVTYGNAGFLALYLVSGFTGNVASFLMTDSPSLGASTAIFGLLAAQGIFYYRNRRVLGPGAQRAVRGIVQVAVINLIIGLTPGIDNWGHVGGLMGGALVAWFGGPLYRVEGVMPEFVLINQRNSLQTALAALATAGLFALLALRATAF